MFLAIKQERRSKQIILQASYLKVTTTDARKHGHAGNLSTNGLFSIHLESACYQPLWTFFAFYWFSSQESLQQIPEEKACFGPITGLGSLGAPSGWDLLHVQHHCVPVPDFLAKRLDGFHVHRVPRGISHIEHIHGLLPDRGDSCSRNRQPVLSEDPCHFR